jgi:hypothetical protein
MLREEAIVLDTNPEYAILSDRIRAIRIDRFGDEGASVLASLMGIPEAKLTRMETHGPIPGHLILAFIEVTDASPGWLLSGAGEWYSPAMGSARASGLAPNGVPEIRFR